MRPYFLQSVWEGAGNSTSQKNSINPVGVRLENCRGGASLAESPESLALQWIAVDQGRNGCRGAEIGKNSLLPCAARDTRERVVPPPCAPYRRKRMGRRGTLFPVYEFWRFQPSTKSSKSGGRPCAATESAITAIPTIGDLPPTKSAFCPTTDPTTRPTGRTLA